MSMRSSDFKFPSGFGFSHSGKGGPKTRQAMPKAKAGPATPTAEMHRGGRSIEFHPDGRIMVHHGASMDEHDSSELAHRQNFAKGGHVEAKEQASDIRQDKALVKKGVRQHETQEHGGKHSTLKLAEGGAVKGGRNKVRPKETSGALSQASALNREPENPQETETSPAHELLPAGNEPYGVEPSDEPENAGSRQGIPQLAKGGRVKNYARGGKVEGPGPVPSFKRGGKAKYAGGGAVQKAQSDFDAAVKRQGYVSSQTNDAGQRAAAQKAVSDASAALTAARQSAPQQGASAAGGSFMDKFRSLNNALSAPAGRAKGGKVRKGITARQAY